jgi:hypothetical protein
MISRAFFVYTFFGVINLRPKSLQESLKTHWRIKIYGGVRSPTDLTPAIGRGEQQPHDYMCRGILRAVAEKH